MEEEVGEEEGDIPEEGFKSILISISVSVSVWWSGWCMWFSLYGFNGDDGRLRDWTEGDEVDILRVRCEGCNHNLFQIYDMIQRDAKRIRIWSSMARIICVSVWLSRDGSNKEEISPSALAPSPYPDLWACQSAIVGASFSVPPQSHMVSWSPWAERWDLLPLSILNSKQVNFHRITVLRYRMRYVPVP